MNFDLHSHLKAMTKIWFHIHQQGIIISWLSDLLTNYHATPLIKVQGRYLCKDISDLSDLILTSIRYIVQVIAPYTSITQRPNILSYSYIYPIKLMLVYKPKADMINIVILLDISQAYTSMLEAKYAVSWEKGSAYI